MYSTQTMPYHVSKNMANKNPFWSKAVRSALNETQNNININQVRSAFSNNPNSTSPNINAFYTPTPNNFNNTAVYSTSHYMTQAHNARNVMEERRPRMTTNVNNMQKT